MGFVYTLICSDGYFYIGSTKRPISARFQSHKDSSKRCDTRLYNHINSIGWDNVNIELLEECENYREREQWYLEEYYDEYCLNSIGANLSNDEKIKRQRENYFSNIDKSRASARERANRYASKNRESINQKQRERREKNREAYNQKQRERRARKKE